MNSRFISLVKALHNEGEPEKKFLLGVCILSLNLLSFKILQFYMMITIRKVKTEAVHFLLKCC
jgi:hypothetical protein